jgi:hypothetical protein
LAEVDVAAVEADRLSGPHAGHRDQRYEGFVGVGSVLGAEPPRSFPHPGNIFFGVDVGHGPVAGVR